jgi:signal transduction histidine kinase
VSRHAQQRIRAGTVGAREASAELVPLDPRVLVEQVRMLYARASIAQATVVVNAVIVAWIFRDLVSPARALGWVTALCALSALRIALVRAFARSGAGASDARTWARRFAAGAALTGICWGAAVLVFYAPGSPIHTFFLAFVLGGMTAGAASSNASYPPAFAAFAVPALLPMVVRLGAERTPIHAAMAFMVALFGVAVGAISRSGSRTIEQALRLRFRNEALVERLTAAQQRLERANAGLEQRVRERTGELEQAVSELVDAHEALRASDSRKDEFIAVLSHELRNPLSSIRASIYVLEHASPDSAAFARAREIIQRQTRHLARLVDDLLDATRISRGKIELRRSRIDVSEVVRRACTDHRAAFHERGVVLRVEADAPAWVDADETRIAQVIGNLLQNAAKFSREGGTAVVRTGAVAGKAEIRVRDEGVGISADLLPRVFEPFFQAGQARAAGGLGLGLALVKGLVELHGGSVQASSDGLDRGAEFAVTLPLAPAGEGPAAPPPMPVRPPRRAPARVLVIEDDADSAGAIADVLALEGHHVHVATNARSGIAMARELKPDVVVCDLGLPDMDGYEIVRTLRRDDRLRSTRFIALSGYAQPEDRRRAAEAGFDEHMSKPADMEVLLAEIAARR